MLLLNSYLTYRESEGSFQYGGYWREADDLHAVIQHFRGAKRVIHAIVGHSKGMQFICVNIKIFSMTTKKGKKKKKKFHFIYNFFLLIVPEPRL